MKKGDLVKAKKTGWFHVKDKTFIDRFDNNGEVKEINAEDFLIYVSDFNETDGTFYHSNSQQYFVIAIRSGSKGVSSRWDFKEYFTIL